MAIAAGRPEGGSGAERLEIRREAPDEVEDDLLDPLGVLDRAAALAWLDLPTMFAGFVRLRSALLID